MLPRRFPHPLATTLALVCVLLSTPAAAVPLPLAMNLEGGPVTLRLWGADVWVRVDPQAPPSLVARWQPEGAHGEEIELLLEAGETRIGRPAATAEPGAPKPRRLRVEVVARPGQLVRIEGQALTVNADGGGVPAPASAASAKQAAADTGVLGLALAVEGSQVSVAGFEGLEAKVKDGWTRLDAMQGRLSLEVEGGGLELRGHLGSIEASGQGAEMTLAGVGGDVQAVLVGGSLDVQDGTGSLTAQVREASARIAGWQGPMSIRAETAGVEIRGSETMDGRIDLSGLATQVFLEEVRGSATVRLEGGSVAMTGYEGEAKVEAQADAQVTVSGFRGALALQLRGGASAGAKEIAGNLTVEMADGRLQVDQTGRLEVTAQRSEVTAAGITELGRVEVTDGRLDLDLSELHGDPRVVLRGTTEARVRLSTPCIVRAIGAVAFDGSQLEVTACDQNATGQGSRTAALRRTYGGQAVVLTANLDATARLEVEGEP